MPLRRKILASLAPLLGLSALIAAMAAQPGEATLPQPGPGISSLVQLLRTVAHLTAPVAEYSSVRSRHHRPSPHATLALSALVATPFHNSVWMLQSRPPALPLPPHLQHSPLRC
jgi:hypothetical protein